MKKISIAANAGLVLCAVTGGDVYAQAIAPDPFDDPAFTRDLPPLDQPILPPEAVPDVALPVENAGNVDRELAAPLPPLATFDTAVIADVADPGSDKPAAIRYRVSITGLKEIGLERRFRQLSALLDKGTKAANAAQVSARASEDVKLAERIVKAQGYFDAVVTANVAPLPDVLGDVAVEINVVSGAQYRLGRVTVSGPAPEAATLAREALALTSGEPIIADIIQSGEARVALRLPENGYPFATVGARDILLDEADLRGDYTLPVEAGPKSVFGGFQLTGDTVFDQNHIAVFPRFEAGSLYDSRKVDDMRQALVATSLFSSVAVEPVRTAKVAPDGTQVVDLIVTQNKGPHRSLTANAGYATGEGIKLQGAWTHRNLFPPEGALSVEGVAGTREQSAGISFRRANAGQRDRALLISASIARQRFDAYNAETFDLSGSLSRSSTPIWQKRWTWSVGAELVATRETRFDPARGVRLRNIFFIAALPLQIGYDQSNSLLDPTRGFRVTARVSPEAQQRARGGFDSYGRGLVEASGYFPFGEAIVLAGRARIGVIAGAARDDIAPSRRLYAGGGGSVRGFGYQELGPKDVDNNPIGGRALTEFAIEGRYRFGDFGVVGFVDAGRVGEKTTPSLNGMRYGAGLGARYYTNFGPLRIDVATPLARQAGESRIALYLSIGQAF